MKNSDEKVLTHGRAETAKSAKLSIIKRQFVLIGGAFNPVTTAHISIGTRMQKLYPNAEVVYVPAANSYIKSWKEGSAILPEDVRLGMLLDAVQTTENLRVSLREINAGESKCYNTICGLREIHIRSEFIIAIGDDKLPELEKWYKIDEIMEMPDVKFTVITRNGPDRTELVKKYPHKFEFVDLEFDYCDISSSKIREAFANGKGDTVKDMLPDGIYEKYAPQLEEAFVQKENKAYSFDAVKAKLSIVTQIREWFDKNGKRCNAVIGISGGKDSSIVAALCVEALGKERVIGVLMPNGEQSDIHDAYEVVSFLGIEHYEINIASVINAEYRAFMRAGLVMSEQTEINLPPRVRMTTLYAISQSNNGRVMNTCNLSENYIGYSTIFGDAAGDFSPIGSYTVAEVIAIGNETVLPKHLVEKVPADGLCGKTDENSFGFSYKTLDAYIREGICEDPFIKEKIDRLHKRNLFKMQPIATAKAYFDM